MYSSLVEQVLDCQSKGYIDTIFAIMKVVVFEYCKPLQLEVSDSPDSIYKYENRKRE